MEKIEIGTKVWLKPDGNAARYNPDIREREITEIGKRYIYVGQLRFDKKTFKYVDRGSNSDYVMFFDEVSGKEYLEAELLRRDIIKVVSYRTLEELKLNDLRTIYSILKPTTP